MGVGGEREKGQRERERGRTEVQGTAEEASEKVYLPTSGPVTGRGWWGAMSISHPGPSLRPHGSFFPRLAALETGPFLRA